jgi:hypothetical protein
MNRKLHNSLMALLSSSTLLLVGMLAGTPGTLPADRESMAITTPVTPMASATPTESQHSQRGQNRRTFQSVRMPFFSFFLPKE